MRKAHPTGINNLTFMRVNLIACCIQLGAGMFNDRLQSETDFSLYLMRYYLLQVTRLLAFGFYFTTNTLSV